MNSIETTNYHSYSDLLKDPQLAKKKTSNFDGEKVHTNGSALFISGFLTAALISGMALAINYGCGPNPAFLKVLMGITWGTSSPFLVGGIAAAALGHYTLHKKRTPQEINKAIQIHYDLNKDSLELKDKH